MTAELKDRITYSREDSYGAPAQFLIGRLVQELGQIYHIEGVSAFHPGDAPVPGSVFVIAWQGERPVGCGALRPFAPGMAEVRRMYVEPELRRQGIARQILEQLEKAAEELGYHTLRLETGTLQPGAIRLYETAGYGRISCYGKYADDPLSVCFEKRPAACRGEGEVRCPVCHHIVPPEHIGYKLHCRRCGYLESCCNPIC